jgi:hypothetical protein
VDYRGAVGQLSLHISQSVEFAVADKLIASIQKIEIPVSTATVIRTRGG